MPYIGNTPALDYISYAVQNFTVTAGTTSYALDYSVANENDIRLVINNVIQRPGASFAYSATGTTLTLTSATLATDTMYAVFIGRAVQTVTPPANINIQLADGTAAAPSLNFANDTNTGIFRATTDEIALVEGGVEGMRLNASGNVQFAKNISIGGATPTTSGFGITFPGTQSASTNANTLDDYEEGTWTPVISGSTSGSGTPTGGSTLGRYTKIGNLVYVNYFIADVTFPTFAGELRLSLPFAASSGSHFYWGDAVYFYPNGNWETVANFVDIYLRIGGNDSVAKVGIYETNDDRQDVLVQGVNCNLSAQSGLYFQTSIVYNTA
jgi:hypothetical protein